MNKYLANLTKEQIVASYLRMLSVRRLEEKIGQLYSMGKIRGFCHLYIGQEAVVSGIYNVMQNGDSIITSYREHGFALLSGETPERIIAELMGKATGCSKGKGGSMHMFNVSRNFFGGHGIVGAQVPIGTGIAFSSKYKNNKNVVFTCLGDGAINQGQVYEAFNMAALWKLPVIYVVENNEYAMGTSVSRSSFITDLYRRGEGCGVPGLQVDGMDLFEVTKAAAQAAEHCRNNNGPILLEMKTYRYRGHSMSDPAKYRSREEVEQVRTNKDSLRSLCEYITEKKILREDEIEQFEQDTRNKMNAAVTFAEASPLPDDSELLSDVYRS